MIEVYYLSTTSSRHKVIKWLENHNFQFTERKISKKKPIKKSELKKILMLSENGFDDLINMQTKKFKDLKINEKDYSTYDLIEVIIKNPSLIKLPIVIDEKKLVIGFNGREIRCFLSKEYRRDQLLANRCYFVEE